MLCCCMRQCLRLPQARRLPNPLAGLTVAALLKPMTSDWRLAVWKNTLHLGMPLLETTLQMEAQQGLLQTPNPCLEGTSLPAWRGCSAGV